VSIFGSPELTELMVGVGVITGVEVAVTRGLSGDTSEYASFQNVGVTYFMLFGDDTTRIHSAFGTLEFVQAAMLGGATASTLALLQSSEIVDLVNGD